MVVAGEGAPSNAVPPLGLVYHFSAVPVAVNGAAVEFWQRLIVAVTVGAVEGFLTTTATSFL